MLHIKVKPYPDKLFQMDSDSMEVADMYSKDRHTNVNACVTYFKHVYHTDKRMYPTPFHQALINNDAAFYADVMDKLDDELKSFVLNCPLTWSSGENEHHPFRNFQNLSLERKLQRKEIFTGISSDTAKCANADKWKVALPLSLVAISGNSDFVQQALRDGANHFSADNSGNNLIHDLVNFSSVNPSVAVTMFHDVVSSLPDTSIKEQLLKYKNKKGKTPLDLAAKKHLPEMFLAIINTDDVYRIPIKECLLHKHVLSDVSEYESPLADQVSPLHYFKSLTDEEVRRHDNCHFFESAPVKAWIEARCNTSRYLFRFFYILWVAYYCIYWLCALDYILRQTVHSNLLIALMTFSAFVLFSEWTLDIRRFHTDAKAILNFLRSGRVPATLTCVYRKAHNFFAYCCLIFCGTHLSGHNCTRPDIAHLAFVASGFFGGLSLLYMLQINKRVGHLLILFLKMLYDTAIFLIVGSVFYFTATNVFYAIEYPVDTCSANKTVISLHDALGNYGAVMFETFLLILAIKAPSAEFFDVWIAQITSAIYVVAVVLFTVILLNMLIGLMSRRITEIEDHKETLVTLEKLSVVYHYENGQRMPFWFRLGIPQKYFRVSKDFSKVYVEVIEKRMK